MGSRLLSFTYGGYTVAEQIHKWSESIDASGTGKRYSLTVDFLITAAGASALHTAVSLAETSLAAPEGNLVITMDGSNRRSYTSGTDTRLVTTRLSKPGSEFDSETSNLLRFEYRAALGLSDDGGRTNSSGYARLIDASGLRMVHMHGAYQFNGATTARAQYDAGIVAWVSSAFTALGLTEADYELISDDTFDSDDEGTSVDFRRIYEEVRTTPANANIKRFRASISTSKATARGDTRVEPIIEATVQWSCNVDKAIGDDEDLKDLYDATIRADLASRIKTGTGATNIIVTQEHFSLDETRSIVSGTLRANCFGKMLFLFEEALIVQAQMGKARRRRWSGIANDYVTWTPGPYATATIVTRFSQISAAGWSDWVSMHDPPALAGFGDGFWDQDGYMERSGSGHLGDATISDGAVKTWDVEIVTTWRWVANRTQIVQPAAPADSFGGLRGLETTTGGR